MARRVNIGSGSDIPIGHRTGRHLPSRLPDDDLRPELPLAETAVLWAIRTWVAGCRLRVPTKRIIGSVFAELGAPEAGAHLCGLMRALSEIASRTIAVHGPCYPDMSDDEQILLDVLALTQDGQTFERLLLLRAFLQPLAATSIGESAAELVRELNRAGLFLLAAYAPVRHHACLQEGARTGSDQRHVARAR